MANSKFEYLNSKQVRISNVQKLKTVWNLKFAYLKLFRVSGLGFKTSGFTLVELVLVIALLGIFGLVLGPGLAESVRGYQLVQSRKTNLAQARAGFERIVREARLIPDPSDILTTSPTTFQFEYPNGNPITYTLSGSTVQRNGQDLVENVSSLAFTYYTETGSTTTNASLVRRVGMQMTTSPSGNAGSLNLRTQIFIRNTGNSNRAYNVQ